MKEMLCNKSNQKMCATNCQTLSLILRLEGLK